MVPCLFPEVTDHIIDYLHADKPSLLACSLTCKTWVASSRYHLFSKVQLDPTNIQSFSKLLDNSSNNIAAVIRHLTISAYELSWKNRGLHSRECEATTFLAKLPGLTARLRMVKSLSLHRMSWEDCSPEILQNTLSNLGAVEVLELSLVSVRGLDEAVGIICALPLLKTLSLDGVSITWPGHPFDDSNSPRSVAWQPQRPPFALDLIDFCYSFSPPAPLVRWLLDHTSNIHTLRCHPVVQHGHQCLQTTLTSAGPSKLEVIACNIASLVDNCPIINITKCATLQSIYFHGIQLSPEFAHSNRLFVLPILNQVCSPSFEELILNIAGIDINWTAQFDWKGIAESLLQPRFSSLKKICIEWPVTFQEKPPSIRFFLERGPFSPLTGRGLIQVKIIPGGFSD